MKRDYVKDDQHDNSSEEFRAWLRKSKNLLMISTVFIVVLTAAVIAGIIAYGNNQNSSRSDTTSKKSSPINTSPESEQEIKQPSQEEMINRITNSEAYNNPLTDLAYDKLFRNSEEYEGEFIRYRGEVIQVLGESGGWNLRVNVTKDSSEYYTFWEDTVFIYSYSEERVLEDDIIEFTGMYEGTTTYESVMGGDITIPSFSIYEHKLINSS